MAYFKIDNTDFSMFVNSLKIDRSAVYNAQTNAAGNTVVDYINTKRTIEVGIIPLNSDAMAALQTAIDKFSVTLSFRNPKTEALEEGVAAIIPNSGVEYYTIQSGNVSFKALKLQFTEL